MQNKNLDSMLYMGRAVEHWLGGGGGGGGGRRKIKYKMRSKKRKKKKGGSSLDGAYPLVV